MIAQYVAALNAFLTSEGVAIRGIPIQVLLGKEHVMRADVPPRVVVWPVGGVFGPAMQAAGLNPRALRTRNINLEWELWGGDYEEVEALIQCVAHGLFVISRGSFELGDEQWDLETLDDQHGRKLAMRSSFYVPITDRRYGDSYPYTTPGGPTLDPGGAPVMSNPLHFEAPLTQQGQTVDITGTFKTET